MDGSSVYFSEYTSPVYNSQGTRLTGRFYRALNNRSLTKQTPSGTAQVGYQARWASDTGSEIPRTLYVDSLTLTYVPSSLKESSVKTWIK